MAPRDRAIASALLEHQRKDAIMWRLITPAAFAFVVALPPAEPSVARAVSLGQQKGSRVDLVQVQLLAPKKVRIGKVFRVMDTVENQGDSLALESLTAFYLSQDDQWDEKDVLVGGRRVPQLGKDQTHETMTPVTLKPEIVPGNYYFLALADARRQLEERYRENNLRAVPILVLPADK